MCLNFDRASRQIAVSVFTKCDGCFRRVETLRSRDSSDPTLAPWTGDGSELCGQFAVGTGAEVFARGVYGVMC